MKTLAKVGLTIGGILLFILGFIVFFSPLETIMSLSWVWAIFFFVGGIFNIFSFITMDAPGVIKALTILKGIVQVILGVLLIQNGVIFATLVALSVFQIWIIFSGIEEIIASFALKDAGVTNWWLTLILGILSLILGMSFFASAILSTTLITVSVTLGLIISGIALIASAFDKNRS